VLRQPDFTFAQNPASRVPRRRQEIRRMVRLMEDERLILLSDARNQTTAEHARRTNRNEVPASVLHLLHRAGNVNRLWVRL